MESERAGAVVEMADDNAVDLGLAATGDHAVSEFRCVESGYAAIVSRELPPCPMCGGASWRRSAWSPFTRPAASARPH
jgi:hypothetical protein